MMFQVRILSLRLYDNRRICVIFAQIRRFFVLHCVAFFGTFHAENGIFQDKCNTKCNTKNRRETRFPAGFCYAKSAAIVSGPQTPSTLSPCSS